MKYSAAIEAFQGNKAYKLLADDIWCPLALRPQYGLYGYDYGPNLFHSKAAFECRQRPFPLKAYQVLAACCKEYDPDVSGSLLACFNRFVESGVVLVSDEPGSGGYKTKYIKALIKTAIVATCGDYTVLLTPEGNFIAFEEFYRGAIVSVIVDEGLQVPSTGMTKNMMEKTICQHITAYGILMNMASIGNFFRIPSEDKASLALVPNLPSSPPTLEDAMRCMSQTPPPRPVDTPAGMSYTPAGMSNTPMAMSSPLVVACKSLGMFDRLAAMQEQHQTDSREFFKRDGDAVDNNAKLIREGRAVFKEQDAKSQSNFNALYKLASGLKESIDEAVALEVSKSGLSEEEVLSKAIMASRVSEDDSPALETPKNATKNTATKNTVPRQSVALPPTYPNTATKTTRKTAAPKTPSKTAPKTPSKTAPKTPSKTAPSVEKAIVAPSPREARAMRRAAASDDSVASFGSTAGRPRRKKAPATSAKVAMSSANDLDSSTHSNVSKSSKKTRTATPKKAASKAALWQMGAAKAKVAQRQKELEDLRYELEEATTGTQRRALEMKIKKKEEELSVAQLVSDGMAWEDAEAEVLRQRALHEDAATTNGNQKPAGKPKKKN